MAKIFKSQYFKTTFKWNLTCLFYLSEVIQKTQFAMTDPVQTVSDCKKFVGSTTKGQTKSYIFFKLTILPKNKRTDEDFLTVTVL